MKIKNICKNAAIMGLGALMLTGCASDYLDTPVYGSIDATQVAANTDNARAAVLTIGSAMSRFWMNSNGEPSLGNGMYADQGETGVAFYLGEMPGSDCYINCMYDQAPVWASYYTQQPGWINSGGYVWNRPMWMYCYSLIAQLNEIIHYIDGAEGDEGLREFTKAQAYTFRAHFYWRLLQTYAPRWEDSENGTKLSSVVIRTAIDEPTDKAVAPMNEVLDLIYSDLDKAIEAFGKAGNTKRVNNFEPYINVAYGVYARTAALKHDWAKCRDMAKKAHEGLRPATTEEAMGGYMYFNSNEWMWAPSFEPIDNAIYGNWCAYNACNSYGAINDRMTLSIDIMLYRQLPETDARRDWWITADKLSGVNKNLVYNTRAVNATTQQYTAVALTKAARAWLDERQAKYSVPGLAAYSGSQSTSVIRDGAQVKFWCDGLTGENARCQVPFMRATEMYLYEAEACAMLGETGAAQELLNEINRPHNPDYTCNVSGQALIDEVRLYRRIELWGEGFCWFDLKRWNIPMERKAWVAGDPTSGNMPEGIACVVPVKRNNGWRHGIPISERSYNMAITQPIPGETLNTAEE